MQARYSSTKNLRDIAKDIMEHRLGCGYQTFAMLMGRSKSWCNNFINGNVEVRGLFPEDITRLFAIEYNCVLFENKMKQMAALLVNAIDSNICKPETSLSDVFKKIEFYDDTGNICMRYKVPIEIFCNKQIPLPDKIFLGNNNGSNYIFKENAFAKIDIRKTKEYMEGLPPEELQEKHFTEIDDYIKLYDYETSTIDFPDSDKDTRRVSAYISRRLEKILDVKNGNYLSDYWLYATYFQHKDIELGTDIIESLKKWYCTGKEKKVPWENIFNTLQISKKESMQFDSGEIYFLNDIKQPISNKNYPVMFMKYNWKSNTDLKNKKVEDATSGKIKLIDLFMLIYNVMLRKEYGKNEAFEKTCARLYYGHYATLFDKLNILSLPYDKNIALTEESWEFFKQMKELINSFDFDEKNPELIQFKKNFNAGQLKYLRAISVDFSFIEKLSMFNVIEINEDLTKMLETYKADNLL